MPPQIVYVYLSAEWSYGHGVFYGVLHYAKHETHWAVGYLSPHDRESRLPEETSGLIVHQLAKCHLAEEAVARKIPVVGVGDVPQSPGFASVQSDHQAIGRLAAQHLLERGFRRLGFLGTRQWYSQQRCAGFEAAARSAGASVSVCWSSDTGDEAERQSHSEWLRGLQPPIGLMGCHDGYAAGLMDMCREIGYRVPQDAAVIGVDNERLTCETHQPTISSIVVASRQIGRQAAALLADLMKGRPCEREHIQVPPLGVFARESTQTFASDEPIVARAVRLMQQDITKAVSIMSLLRELGVSRRQLEYRFQSALGRSPGQVLRYLRIERAKLLLQTSTLPLSTIAADCGFHSRFHFARAFRQDVGVAPSRYRGHLGSD